MKYIVVVECAASGQMYVDDILEMGYLPLLIYVKIDEEHAAGFSANVANVIKGVGYKAECIMLEKDDGLQEVLSKIEGYDIVCVVPGSDPGVRLADELNKALGLKGNNPETTYMRCTKAGMDEALTKAGIRHIMTTTVTSEDDVRRFWNDNGLTKAVLKFSESAATVGLKICDSLDDCIAHFKAMGSMYTMAGEADIPILMQEYIGGTEYIVNSLSIDGKHKITDLWRYEKIVQEDGILVYDTCILIDRLGPGMQELIQYDYKVLDAVDMQNGFCHNEFKIDSKGPVLIETNPRPMGGSLTREFLNEIFGSHMTDITLKAILEPTFFPNFMLTPYMPRKSAMIKFSIVPRDVKADFGPFFEIVRHLDSYREIVYFGEPGVHGYERTIDLETVPFQVKLTNSDYGLLKRDYELIRQIEEHYFDIVFNDRDYVAPMELITDVKSIMGHLPAPRRFALVEDEVTTVHQFGKIEVTKVWGVYDGIVFAKHGESTLTDRFRDMMEAMNQVRKGGILIIVPESYQALPYGMVGAEVLMTAMGFNAEIPPSVSNGVLYGIKR